MTSKTKVRKNVNAPQLLNYPRPQLRRPDWLNLDGIWRFTYDDAKAYKIPADIHTWPQTIEVPFAPECERSGIGDQTFHACCWYEREFEIPPSDATTPLSTILHFGAVDYSCKVWINGDYVGSHEGGHASFELDITHAVRRGGTQVVTLRVEDDPQDLAKPRGKQDWQPEAHSIWYPRTTGIWQTVWVEQVPEIHIDRVRWTPHMERWELGCEVFMKGTHGDGLTLKVTLAVAGQPIVNDAYAVIGNVVHRRISFSDPGIDDSRNELLWSPERPTLIQAELALWDGDRLIDRVESYSALRAVAVHRDRFMLNCRPYYLRLVLDQGYWPDTGLTPPSEEALRRDIQLAKQMGFNGVRKHQKVEDPRYLYWADVLGFLVWEEMPSAYRFTHESVERLTHEWIEIMDRDYNHPCIVLWVPFNESWGVPDLAAKATHQNYVQALYHLTHTLDGTRPVIGNDGWESTATDVIGIHDYDSHPERLAERYGPSVDVTDLIGKRRPGGRMLTVEGHPHRGQPFMLTEFGGIACVRATDKKNLKAWGYDVGVTVDEFQQKYTALLKVVNRIELFSGFCYTQLTDTFQEVNGLLYANREPKFPIEEIAAATVGGTFSREEAIAHTVRAQDMEQEV
jgi:beta-galactosidase/beta-glucuronidase